MAKRMIQIPGVSFGMRSRTDRFKFLLRQEELDRFIASQSQEADGFRSRRERRSARWALLKMATATAFEELSRYADLCLARFIVWRATRRNNKTDKGQ